MNMKGDAVMRMTRRSWAAVALLAAAVIPAWSAGTPQKLPFTVSKETTWITEPLQADGTPDYVAALNAIGSQGVTPANNGFVAWAEIFEPRPRAAIFGLPKPLYDQALALAGAKAAPAGQKWVEYKDYLREQHILVLPEEEVNKFYEVYDLSTTLWTPEEHPDAAAYLKAMESLINQAEVATDRTKWWSPLVRRNGLEDGSVQMSMMGDIREVTLALSARATLRAPAGDWAGCQRDVLAVKRLGSLLSRATPIERLVGYALDARVNAAVGAIAASGKLTAAQCAELRQALADVPPVESAGDMLNTASRAGGLEMMMLVATGKLDVLKAAQAAWEAGLSPDDKVFLKDEITDSHTELTAYESIDRAAVDWDEALRQANKMIDLLPEIERTATVKDMQARGDALTEQLADWKTLADVVEDRTSVITLRKWEGESRADYTTRVTHAMLGRSVQSPVKFEILYRRSRMSDDMAQVILAAAERKAKTGEWPAQAEELVPEFFKAIPRDMNSADFTGTEALRYKVTDKGPRVFSAGEGLRDFGIGAELGK